MIHLNISTLIYQPIKQVFDFISTPENDFQWQYGTLSSNKISKKFGSIGSLFRSIGHFMGQRLISTFELTEFEQNKKYSFKSVSGPLNSHTTYTFELYDGGTKVNIATQMNVVNSLQLNELTLEKKMRKQLTENLALLKEILETNQIGSINDAVLAVY